MKIELKKLSDLKPAPYNPRQSNAEQEKQLKSSLEKFGVVEPIIFNKQTGFIVGGHFRIRELKKLGYKEIECVIVDLNEADEKELNIRLNANTGSWDWDDLANNWDEEQLIDWGLNIPNFDNIENETIEEKYTNKIEIPIYEPSDKKPNISELYNLDKYNELITKINSLTSITKEQKEFLQFAATRHIIFNYQITADYYAHSNSEIQDLMEKSALVIIDFNKSIENGFFKMSKEINKFLDVE
jgi:hypothetical protein